MDEPGMRFSDLPERVVSLGSLADSRTTHIIELGSLSLLQDTLGVSFVERTPFRSGFYGKPTGHPIKPTILGVPMLRPVVQG